jgi:hypothetical protein
VYLVVGVRYDTVQIVYPGNLNHNNVGATVARPPFLALASFAGLVTVETPILWRR